MIDYDEVHRWLRARLESMADIPPAADRSWPGIDFAPDPTRAHIEEDFVPAPGSVISAPVDRGVLDSPGLYVVRYYGLTNRGESAIKAVAQAVLETFPPGMAVTLVSGNRLYVGHNPAPGQSQILPVGKGKSVCTITIPWRVHSFNVIAA